jgi:hypothetical protein
LFETDIWDWKTECIMTDFDRVTADELLERYAESWAKDAASVTNLTNVPTNQELFALLAARASDPQEAFGTPGDRFGTKFDPAILPKGPSVFEVGRRIFLRQAAALHRFLCAPDEEDKELRNRIKAALVSRDVGAVAIIAGSLVAAFGMGAAAAAIVAALLVRIIVVPTADALCEVWDEQIKEATGRGANGAP